MVQKDTIANPIFTDIESYPTFFLVLSTNEKYNIDEGTLYGFFLYHFNTFSHYPLIYSTPGNVPGRHCWKLCVYFGTKIKEIEESNIKNKNRITSEANTLLKVLKSEIKKKEKEKNKVDFMIGGNTSNYEYGYAYN